METQNRTPGNGVVTKRITKGVACELETLSDVATEVKSTFGVFFLWIVCGLRDYFTMKRAVPMPNERPARLDEISLRSGLETESMATELIAMGWAR